MNMFRKAVASLLALLLLTGCAVPSLAESGYVFEVSFEASEDQMTAFEKDLGGDGKTGTAIAQLLNLLRFTSSTSADNSVSLLLTAGDTDLLSAAARVQENGLLQIASNLFPGIRLEMDLPSDENLSQWSNFAACISAAVEKISLQSVALRGEAMLFIDSLNPEVESGVFSGDAYTGGVERYTYRFDNRDVAFLFLRLVNKLEGMDEVFSTYGCDWKAAKRELTDICMDFADKNEYHYIVRTVYDEHLNPLRSYQPDPIGQSVTVFRGEEQVATLSLGQKDQVEKIVLGFGFEQKVYMIDIEISGTSVTDSLDIAGSVKLWQDPYREGYRAASSDPSNLLGELTINQLTVIVNQGFTAVYDAAMSITGKRTLRETGRIQINGNGMSYTSSLYYDHSDVSMLTLRATTKPGEPLPYSWPEGQTINVNDESSTMPLINAAIQGITDLNVRLQKALPSDLYQQIMNWIGTGITDVFGPQNFD